MLGETLSDPHHVEAGGTIKGMGLLPMDTVFAEKKTRTQSFRQISGDWRENCRHFPVQNWRVIEIHMGETVLKGEAVTQCIH